MIAQLQPATWAEIAERIGIPAAVLLLVLIALGLGAAWVARHVIQPLVNSWLAMNKAHVDFVKKCGDAIDRLSLAEVAQTAEIGAIRKQGAQTLEAVRGVDDRMHELKTMVSQLGSSRE